MGKEDYLASILDEAGKAGNVFKQVFAAELCRRMDDMHEETTSVQCTGCKVNHPSQLRHACCGYGEYFHFHPNFHGRLYIHKAIGDMDQARLDDKFAKGLYLTGLPHKYLELVPRFKKRAELSWFSDIWDLIRSCKIDSDSCLFNFVVLPPREEQNIVLVSQEGSGNGHSDESVEMVEAGQQSSAIRKPGDGIGSEVVDTLKIVDETVDVNKEKEKEQGIKSSKRGKLEKIKDVKMAKEKDLEKEQNAFFSGTAKFGPKVSKPVPYFLVADSDEEADEAAEAEIKKKEEANSTMAFEAYDEDPKMSTDMIEHPKKSQTKKK